MGLLYECDRCKATAKSGSEHFYVHVSSSDNKKEDRKFLLYPECAEHIVESIENYKRENTKENDLPSSFLSQMWWTM